MNDTWRFILISGGTDQTIPNGSGDVRYHQLRGMPQGSENYNLIINSDSVVHWNRDVYHPKISSMPTGMIGADLDNIQNFKGIIYKPIIERLLMIMSADRLRACAQWADR